MAIPVPSSTALMIFNILVSLAPASALDGRLLLGAGIVPTGDRQVNVYTSSQTGIIALKLLPNLPKDKENCAEVSIRSYNETLTRILTPLAQSMAAIRGNSTVSTRGREPRLVGAIIGGVALGVATAAQITAATALIQANQNAENIARLAKGLAATNEAVTDLTKGVGSLAIGVGKLQDYVNEQFNRTGEAIECLTIESRVGVQLSLYLTEVIGVFGDQITSPALSDISIQALYNLAGGNLNVLLQKMGIEGTQLGSLINSGLIKGRPIMYDDGNKILGIQVTLPSVGRINGARATLLEAIAVATPKGNASPLIPRAVISVGSLVEELDMTPCVLTPTDIFCTRILSYPLSDSLTTCLKGNLSSCVFSRTEGALSTPYVSVHGKIVANCKSVVCRCVEPQQIISQNYGEALSLIDESLCRILELNGVILKMDGQFTSEYTKNITIDPVQVIISGPIDISSELSQVNQSLDSALENIKESNSYLSKVNVKLISSSAMITYIVITVICLILTFVALVLGIYSYTKIRSQQKTLIWMGNNIARSKEGNRF
ncbi:fusion protein [avian paramyxovirus 12]|uniref:Fusion glycoprotein F0 n=1 Tax=avian paramyxovirus 12 TaxID=2560320 RepID=M4QRF5_9MONO|nr:fusion protein [Avian orthoavulavirus 12]AGH32601.1 fusion protein [Avian orthoavulavirus 12]